jgi:pilus assembly protein Flp/PilA
MLQRIRRFIRDEEGPTAVEYAIMVAGVGLVILAAVFLLGGSLSTAFHNVADHVPFGKTGN